MPSEVLSHDMVAICLVLADGDIRTSVECIVRRAEDYQETTGRHFGISTTDFRGLFQWLTGWELRIVPLGSVMDSVSLGDIVGAMLEYHDAYCNDEGNYWFGDGDLAESDYLDIELRGSPCYSMLDDAGFQEKLRQRRVMKAFFELLPHSMPSVESVKTFMRTANINDTVLRDFSLPGMQS